MILVNIMHPNSTEAKFDMDYFRDSHVPMVVEILGSALKGAVIYLGLAGCARGESAAFIATGNLTFSTVEALQRGFGRESGEKMADLANFTNVSPQIQISEIIV